MPELIVLIEGGVVQTKDAPEHEENLFFLDESTEALDIDQHF